MIAGITAEQEEILLHAVKNQVFCGEGEEVEGLVDLGLMEFYEKRPFVLKPYYRLTPKGVTTLSLRETREGE